jgi:hypothetical protein
MCLHVTLLSASKLIKSVRIKDIQNKIITFQKAFIIHTNGLHHYKRKLSEFILSI